MCITSCGRKVFGYDAASKKAVVKNPLHCMIGCTSCEVWCVHQAISFPDKQIVRDFIKENKLLQKAKADLDNMLSQIETF